MNDSFVSALSLQGRVLFALSLREIQGRHGKSRLGYLWQFVKTGLGIGVFWALRGAMGGHAPAALPFPLMLTLGFIPWFIFAGTLSKTVEAVSTNNALLTFPQITPLDLYFSSAAVSWVTELIIMAAYFVLLLAMGFTFHLYAPLVFFTALAGICLFSFGLGLVLGSLNVYFPFIEKLMPPVMRVLFLTSGVFFSPTQVGTHYSRYLYMNPVTNFIELLRHSFVYPDISRAINLNMIICLTFGLLALGLLLERRTRVKQGQL